MNVLSVLFCWEFLVRTDVESLKKNFFASIDKKNHITFFLYPLNMMDDTDGF